MIPFEDVAAFAVLPWLKSLWALAFQSATFMIGMRNHEESWKIHDLGAGVQDGTELVWTRRMIESSKLFFSLKFSVRNKKSRRSRESVRWNPSTTLTWMAWRRNSIRMLPFESPCLRGKKAPGTSPILYLLFYTVLFRLFSGCLVGFHPGYIPCPECLKPEYSETLSNWGLHSVRSWTIRDGSRILANPDCLELTLSTNVCKKPILSFFASSTSIESWTLSSILRRTLCLFFARAFCRWWTAG